MAMESTRPKALITGASAGIGEAFARHLARRGYDLVLVARRLDRLSKLAGEVATAHSIVADVMEADLATDEGVSRVESRLRSQEFDMLVNNAGFGTFGAFVDRPLARELEELDVNVRALMRLSHAALTSMTKRGVGAIINVASTAAFQAIPYNATYAATKAFVLHFSEALHEEAKEHGVT
ncbi:MAG: SDR family NAD(P)-dependent oxidoreductase, partial [Dehalococcoidia bacterium]